MRQSDGYAKHNIPSTVAVLCCPIAILECITSNDVHAECHLPGDPQEPAPKRNLGVPSLNHQFAAKLVVLVFQRQLLFEVVTLIVAVYGLTQRGGRQRTEVADLAAAGCWIVEYFLQLIGSEGSPLGVEAVISIQPAPKPDASPSWLRLRINYL